MPVKEPPARRSASGVTNHDAERGMGVRAVRRGIVMQQVALAERLFIRGALKIGCDHPQEQRVCCGTSGLVPANESTAPCDVLSQSFQRARHAWPSRERESHSVSPVAK